MASDTIQLLAHEPQARRLHRVLVMKKEDANRLTLPDPPRPPARLTQRVQGIARFIKNQAGMAEQVQASFDDSGMADRYLHSLSQSLSKPSFPLFGWHIGRQHCDANALSRENVRQPAVTSRFRV
jgi:hypothetical protein